MSGDFFSGLLEPGEIGRFRYLWDGRDAQGNLLPPGIYEYQVKFFIPYQAEYCYPVDGIFGNPPDCDTGGTGIFVTANKDVWAEGTIELNTQIDTPFGTGWVLGGVQRLYGDEAGHILAVDGENVTEFYAPGKNLLAQDNNKMQLSTTAVAAEPTAANPQPLFGPMPAPVVDEDVEQALIPTPEPVPAPDEGQTDTETMPPPPEPVPAPDEGQTDTEAIIPPPEPAPVPDEGQTDTEATIPPPEPVPAPDEGQTDTEAIIPPPEPVPDGESAYLFTANDFAPAIDVGGAIVTDTTWSLAGSPYIVTSDVTVNDGVTLTIESGVEVIVNQFLMVRVYGQLTAVGTAAQPITFTAAVSNTSGYWDYLQIGGGSVITDSDGSQLSYVTIAGAGYNNQQGLYIDRSVPSIDHLTIHDSGGEGLYIYNHSRAHGFDMDTVLIEDCGDTGIYINYGNDYHFANLTVQNNGGHGLYLNQDGTLTVTNSTISGNVNYGIYANSNNDDIVLQNSSVNNHSVAARLAANSALSGNTWTGNARNEIEWIGGTIYGDRSWTNQVDAYRILENVRVADGANLTVEQGMEISFAQYRYLYVDGSLTAVGAPTDPITFTGIVSNTPGYWGFVQVGGGSVVTDSDSSQLSYVNIEGGGYNNQQSLYLYRSAPSIDHLTIHDSGGEGIYIYNVAQNGFDMDTVVIEDCGETGLYINYGNDYSFANLTLQNNGGHGLFLNHDGTITVTNATIADNADYGIYANSNNDNIVLQSSVVSGNDVAARLTANSAIAGNTWTGNARNEIEWVGGTIVDDRTWDDQVDAYRILENVRVADGASLTIEPGMQVYFAQYRYLYADGSLTAAGAPTTPITFTGVVSNTPGYWGFVQIGGGSVVTDSDSSQLSYVNIEGGGYNNQQSLYLYRSAPSIDHLTIRDSGGSGMYINNVAQNGFDMDTVVVEDCGGSGIYLTAGNDYHFSNLTLQNNGDHGLFLNHDGTITVTNATISGNGEYGIYAYSNNDDSVLQNSVISNNGVAARLTANKPLSGNTWTGNTRNEIEWMGGTIVDDRTWDFRVDAYRVVGDVWVGDGANLTIVPDMQVSFGQGRRLMVNGSLTAVGAPTTPITFTGIVSNTPGYWAYVQIGGGTVVTDSDSSQLSYVTLEGGGYGYGSPPSLYLYHSAHIDHVTIRDSGGDGVYVHYTQSGGIHMDNITVTDSDGHGVYFNANGTITITNATISNNGSYGIYAYNGDDSLVLQNSVISGNGVAARLSANSTLSGNTWTGNTRNEIEWNGGTFYGNSTWPDQVDAYRILTDMRVADSAHLTILPGTPVIMSGLGVRFYVDGALTAVGTPTEPITFTAIVSNTPGYWGYVQIGGGTVYTDSDSSQLSYVTLEGGGYWSYTGGSLYIYRSAPQIDHLTVRNSGSEGIHINNGPYSPDGFSMDQIVIEDSGENGLYLSNNNTVTVTNATIANSGDYGIYAEGDGDDIVLQDSVISNNGVAARLAPNSALSGNTWTGNIRNEIEWTSGTIYGDRIWTHRVDSYLVVDDVTVADGVNLTIVPGIVVKFDEYEYLEVAGTLTAVGTPSEPITFTGAVSNTAGYWSHIKIGEGDIYTDSNDSHLSYVTIEGGGRYDQSLYFENATPTLEHLTIRNSGGTAIRAENWLTEPPGSFLTIVDSTIENNGGHGITLYEGNYYLDNLTIRNNDGHGVYSSLTTGAVTIRNSVISGHEVAATLSISSTLENNVWTDNAINEIYFRAGIMNRDCIWESDGIEAFHIGGGMIVADGATLTIGAGIDILMGELDNMTVNGNLIAIGTDSAPIVLRPETDDDNWGTLQIGGGDDLTDSNQSFLRYVTIESGGGGTATAALYLLQSAPTLDSLTIRNSGAHGMYVDNSSGVSIQNSNFINSEDYGLYNNSLLPGQVVTATDNYWGAPSGPYHPDTNPSGTGDRVSDNVLYDPWLEEPTTELAIENRTATDYSELVYNVADGSFDRTYLNGTVVHFDAAGFHEYTLDRQGTKTAYTYNPDGSVATMAITAYGRSTPDWVWYFGYVDGKLATITDPAGRVTDFTVDGQGNLAQVAFPDGTTRSFFYNQDELMTQQADQAGEVTAYVYNEYRRIASVIEPLRPVYDYGTGQIEIAQEVRHYTSSDTDYTLINDSPVGDPDNPAPPVPTSEELVDGVDYGNGAVSGHTNKWGKWIDYTDAVGRTTIYERDENNNITRKTFPDGSSIEYEYDDNGNILVETHPQSQEWEFTYEPVFNRIKSKTDPNGNTTTFFYDYETGAGNAGNLVRIEYPPVPNQDGEMATPIVDYTHNDWGQVERGTNPLDVAKLYVYTQGTPDEASDGANPLFLPGVTPVPGLLTQIIENPNGLNLTTVYKDFDSVGEPTTAILPNGAAYHYSYDEMGRVLTQTDPYGIVTRYGYDSRSNLAQVTEDYTPDGSTGLNIVTTYAYNMYDQLTHQYTAADGLIRETVRAYDINRNLAMETDGNGATTLHRYDPANQQTSMTDAEGHTTAYTYTDKGMLETAAFPDGTIKRNVYNDLNQLTQEIVDDGGLHLTSSYAYDVIGNLTMTTDPSGTTTCYTYDALYRMTSIVQDCGGMDLTTAYAYDLEGRVAKTTDPRGTVRIMTYDNAGRLLLQREDDGGINQETTYTYDAAGNVVSSTNARGIVTTYQYDLMSRRLGECIDPSGLDLTTTYTYDALGRRIATTDPNGHTTNITVNAFGNPISQEDPLGNVTWFAYDNVGNLLQQIGPTGEIAQYRYNALNRLTQLTNALGDYYAYEYDSRGNQTRLVDPNGHETLFDYDAAQRVITETDALGNAISYAYDSMGHLTELTDPMGFSIQYAYDAVGRLITETSALSETTVYAYDAGGHRTSVTDGNNHTTTYSYDALGRLTAITNPLGYSTNYNYDLAGNRTGIRDGLNHATHFTYDAANRMTTLTNPLGQITTYAYDPAGQVTSTTYPNGDVIGYTWDAAGRQTAVNYPDSSAINRTFDAAGRAVAVTGPHTDLSMAYDPVGRVTNLSDNLLGKSVGYTYDARGNRTGLNGPDGLTTAYAYDALDQLHTITQGAETFTFMYDDNGRVIRETLSNNATISHHYDAADQLTRTAYRAPDNSLLDELIYGYDAVGNRTSLNLHNGDTVTYGYDAADQLISEQRTGSLAYNQTFSYDAAYNRTRWISDTVTVDYAYNDLNQLTQVVGPNTANFSYDNRARLTSINGPNDTQTFTYNYESLLSTVTDASGATTYMYDAFDRRVGQTVGGVTTRYLYDSAELGATVLAEYGGSGSVLNASYILSPVTNGRMARVSGGQTHYYLRDLLGSTRYLMAADGSLVNRYEYDGFGQAVSRVETVDNPYQFTGGRWDEAIGQYDLRARTYLPKVGRFVQPDPLGHYESANLYQYTQNNPVNRIDPIGWSSEKCKSFSTSTSNDLGLTKFANKVANVFKFIPNGPTIEASSNLSIDCETCDQCCEESTDPNCPGCKREAKVKTVNVSAYANMNITWPLTTLGFEISKFSFNVGVDTTIDFNMSMAGAGEIDNCTGVDQFPVCGSGSIRGQVRAGLLPTTFIVVQAHAYIAGSVTGYCYSCGQYSGSGGFSLEKPQCTASAEVSLEVGFKLRLTKPKKPGRGISIGFERSITLLEAHIY